MFCVALTGNIASGKSTVLQYFSKLGIDTISADAIAKDLTQSNQLVLEKIVSHFGLSVLNQANKLDRRKLRSIIFENPNEREWLENLLHPLIRQKIKEKVQTVNSPYCVIEIPLLPDKSSFPYLNRVLFIEAVREEQIKRIIERDNCSREEAIAILQAQAAPEQHKSIADDVIQNTGSLDELMKQVEDLHRQYLQLTVNNDQI